MGKNNCWPQILAYFFSTNTHFPTHDTLFPYFFLFSNSRYSSHRWISLSCLWVATQSPLPPMVPSLTSLQPPTPSLFLFLFFFFSLSSFIPLLQPPTTRFGCRQCKYHHFLIFDHHCLPFHLHFFSIPRLSNVRYLFYLFLLDFYNN